MNLTDILGHCPECGFRNDAATPVYHDQPGRTPADGDMSICFQCGKPSIFVVTAFGTSCRKATPSEYVELMQDPSYIRAITAWRQLGHGKGRDS